MILILSLQFQTKEDMKEIVDTTEELLWQLTEDRMSEGENFSYESQNLGRKLCVVPYFIQS